MTDVIERDLSCPLTKRELLSRGDRLAHIELEIARLKSERSALSADAKKLADERAVLSNVIERKSERRVVPCEWRKLFDENRVVLVRLDSGDIIDERPLTVDDRQLTLPSEPAEPTPSQRLTKPDSPKAKATRHAH